MTAPYIALEQAFSKLILSASGWRKVFARSGNESDADKGLLPEDADIAYLAASAFSHFLQETYPEIKNIVIGRDSRPTGKAIQEQMLYALTHKNIPFAVQSIGIAAAPEIMCYARSIHAAFVYISASHNPIGHNGLKFGLATGGVLNAEESALLIERFTALCKTASKEQIEQLRQEYLPQTWKNIMDAERVCKRNALDTYTAFLKEVIADSGDSSVQESFFAQIHSQCDAMQQAGKPFTIVADFNGSARAASVDRLFFETHGMQLAGLSEEAGRITHGIVPEGDNLNTCIKALEDLHTKGSAADNALFGYMPDCDGDRGIIIYWNAAKQKAVPLDAQEVFALSVMAELSYMHYSGKTEKPLAVAVNGATSLRINEIARFLDARVFYAEVGEANIVNRARDLRNQGYSVRIFGEGSNGGNITHPAAVRDPLNTLFAIIKLLLIRDTADTKCPFHIWCEKSNQMEKYHTDFTLADVIGTLPAYCTTSTQVERALLKITTHDHSALKRAYQTIFKQEWSERSSILKERFGICSYQVCSYNKTVYTENMSDYGMSGKGGLKIQFYDIQHTAVAFIWMRGSGTEPVFRIIADIKGHTVDAETYLVNWQGDMVRKADMLVQARK